MLPLLGLFFIILTSLTEVCIAASLLELTGLSSEIASFQAISAFFGIGYTTSEAESVVPSKKKNNYYLNDYWKCWDNYFYGNINTYFLDSNQKFNRENYFICNRFNNHVLFS